MSMPSETLVSVVLPTLNGETYISEAIQSVIDQTHTHWELIIVDSFSTDATPEIAARFAAQDARIRVIQHPKEAGRLPGALNAGFQQARQEGYHTWLSDDNCFRPHAFAVMADYLDAHPANDLVYSDYTVQYEDGRPEFIQRVSAPDTLAEKNVVTPSFMYRGAIFAAIGGYRTDYFLAEDYDFWLRTYAQYVLHPINEDLHIYRFHNAALTAQFSRQRISEVVERVLLDSVQRSPWTHYRYGRARMYLYLAATARRQGATARQRRYIRRALWAAPLVVLRRGVLAVVTRIGGAQRSQWLSQRYVALKRLLGRA
ncbi:MAG: glycosyltransferase [Anaerolineae bacterium]|nr:glycosyltransferase [Anaerolineae bacterium]